MPGVLVENVFEMLQHSICLADRFKRVVTTVNERPFKYLFAAQSGRRRSGAKVRYVHSTQLACGGQHGKKFIQVSDELERLQDGTKNKLSGYRRLSIYENR
jgi:hypothetical protein